MSDSSGDERPSPGEFIEDALIEAHHLANLTGLDEAKLARRRLVNAQSASRRTKTRDLLADACEYLELARLERRDAAAGFAKARRYARNAQIGLRHERQAAVERSVVELLQADTPSDRRSLEDFRREVAVNSYDGLKRDTVMEVAFAEIRSQATDGVIENPNAVDDAAGGGSVLAASGDGSDPAANGDGTGSMANGEGTGPTAKGKGGDPAANGGGTGPAASGDGADPAANGEGGDPQIDPETAIRIASLEVDIRRALQKNRGGRRETEFQFVTSDQLVSEEATETS